MKRVVSTTFLLFYVGFTVAASAEHTASWASTLVRHSTSATKEIRSNSPRSPQVRIQVDSFVVFRSTATFALVGIGADATRHPSPLIISDSTRSKFSRGPPALL